MLVLTRQVDQKVIIQCGSERIAITVVRLERGQVALGFEAPKEVVIHRGEVMQEIDRVRKERS